MEPDQIVLDWRPLWRPENDNYRLTLMAAPEERVDTTRNLRSKSWKRKAWLDQGREGACTGFGTAHALSCGPNPWPVNDRDALKIYKLAQKKDEWPGEDYSGSSTTGAMLAARELGYLKAFWWCKTVEEVAHAVSRYGPVGLGCWWYTGMFDADSDWFIHATGRREGGHFVCVAAYDHTDKTFRVDNSWGPEWGLDGSARVTWLTMEKLLSEDGEVALPRKYRRR